MADEKNYGPIPDSFVSSKTQGLSAIYEGDKTIIVNGERRKERTSAPIVGYIRGLGGGLFAAVIGDGGKIVRATDLKGFVGVHWEERQHSEMVDMSVFERVFGKSTFFR